MHEAELYQFLEDDFDCSGMCHPSLFYFGNPTSDGQPEETCLLHFKHALSSQAKPFADTLIVAGVVCLVMFNAHFILYKRPKRSSQEK